MSLFKRLFGKKQGNDEVIVQQEDREQEEVKDGLEEGSLSEEEGLTSVEESEVLAQDEQIHNEETISEEMKESIPLEMDHEEEGVESYKEETLDVISEEIEAVMEQTQVIQEMNFEEADMKSEEVQELPQKQGFIKRLFSGLSKTRDSILKGVDDVLSNFKHIDEDLYEELEEALIMADFGVDTTLHIMEKLRAKVKEDKITEPSELKPALQTIITDFLTAHPTEEILNPEGPTVILVIGVNGVGKTTSIGKMSHLFKSQGKKVLVAAADTFRAAAIEQLSIWTERAGVEIIKHEEGSDAAAVVFDAIAAAKSRKSDVLICDTAGRLQNKANLMKELEKISRIIAREYPEAKKEILIVIDATTGQNALQQVKLFKEVADIKGIILTKLDGTAKGGAIVGIYDSLQVPVKYIGVGEKIDDLQPFDASAFAKALFEEEA